MGGSVNLWGEASINLYTQNHDPGAATGFAASSPLDKLRHETPFQSENCKVYCHEGLSEKESPPTSDRGRHASGPTSFSAISEMWTRLIPVPISEERKTAFEIQGC